MIFIIVYCTLAFGLHGGQGVTGINRQVRNLICAIPFGFTGYVMLPHHVPCVVFFILAYTGSNMGFDKWPLALKGLITFFPTGWLTLPLSYYIGDRTKWKNVTSEYLSGFFYGLTLYIWSLL